MPLETFAFCPNTLVPETIPPEPVAGVSMNGWEFSSRPAVPYRRKFKVTLHGLTWYLTSGGLYDTVPDPGHNARRLEIFYQQHERWREFLWHHPHIGELAVKFAAPVNVPAGISNSGGLIAALEVQFIESQPGH